MPEEEVQGPYTSKQLRNMASTGLVNDYTMVLAEGTETWVEYQTIANQPVEPEKGAKKPRIQATSKTKLGIIDSMVETMEPLGQEGTWIDGIMILLLTNGIIDFLPFNLTPFKTKEYNEVLSFFLPWFGALEIAASIGLLVRRIRKAYTK